MRNVAVVTEASLKEGCLYFDRIIPLFDVLRSEGAMRNLEVLKWRNSSVAFSDDILLAVLMHDVDPTITPKIIHQIMPIDASEYLAPIMKQILKGMHAAYVRWSFDQKRPEDLRNLMNSDAPLPPEDGYQNPRIFGEHS